MSEFVLEANQRGVGKQSQLTELREGGRVPGIIYGFGKEPIAIDVEYNALLKVLTGAGTSNIVKVKVASKEIEVIADCLKKEGGGGIQRCFWKVTFLVCFCMMYFWKRSCIGFRICEA